MIQAILWDVDGTLLNFKKSEMHGIRACLAEIGIDECDEELLLRYEQINRGYWEALERGELTKQEVLLGRFRTFFEREGLHCPDVKAFNDSYQRKLGEVFFENEDSVALLAKLSGKVKQCVVTNGTVQAQHNKLKYSGLQTYLDGIFISDEIGVEKPGIGFFAPVFELLQGIPREEILIVGDSLTSDMRGGNNVGIRCCWYNPGGKENRTGVKLDWEIRHLWDVEKILAGEQQGG